MTSSILTDGLIIAGLTVWFNLIFFWYSNAYCFYFEIALDFATPSIIDILYSSTIVIFRTSLLMLLCSPIILLIKNNISFLAKFDDFSFIIVIGMFLSLKIASLSGKWRAKTMTEFIVIQENPKLVVLLKTGENLVCRKYDEENKEITNEIVLKKFTDEPIYLKKEKLKESEIEKLRKQIR